MLEADLDNWHSSTGELKATADLSVELGRGSRDEEEMGRACGHKDSG